VAVDDVRRPGAAAEHLSILLDVRVPSFGGGDRDSAGAISKLWTEADDGALLTGATAFKDRTDVASRLPDMAGLFESIRDSLSPDLDMARMYYKLKPSRASSSTPCRGTRAPRTSTGCATCARPSGCSKDGDLGEGKKR
jgi:hypothetical protein